MAGCASGNRTDDPFAAAAATLPKQYPACAEEIKAFVALSQLASQMQDKWDILEPALEAMHDEVLDCVEDVYPDPHPVRALSPPQGRETMHPSSPSRNRQPARPTP